MRRFGTAAVLAIGVVLAGCGGDTKDEDCCKEGAACCKEGADCCKGKDGAAAKEVRAVAKLDGRDGAAVKGTATFVAKGGKVWLTVEIEGASAGPHAFHIHEKGDCSSADAKSAGGHWNPTSKAHGKWGEGEFHLGDIGNIEVGQDGKGSLKVETDLWTVGTGQSNDVVGKSVIVHEGADDFKTQPTGNAGKRFGCGVIELTK
ncbi:MAG: superoxide dismutase family protein [Planctomycetes bacterium]|nr:superoxide dismutase family protein [Planctomycetota bacterium]